MGKHYIAHVAYRGTKYYGWQKQADVPSVQEAIYAAIRKSYPLGRIDVKACSRTDRGVHSMGQVVKMLVPRLEDPNLVAQKINDSLQDDIKIYKIARINKSYKVTYLSQFKEYIYFFNLDEEPSSYSFVGHIKEDFNLDHVNKVIRNFIGKNYFGHYQYRSDTAGGFYRNLLDAEVIKANDFFDTNCFSDKTYLFYFKGEGFLKQMVRIMVGTLVNVGLSRTTEDDVIKSLNEVELESKPGFIAPAKGLFLYHINYPKVYQGEAWRVVEDDKTALNELKDFKFWQDGENFELYP